MNRKKIEDTLLKIGVPAGVRGFGYIVDAVMLMASGEWHNQKFTALYEKVGELNGTTGSRVERCIRHALESARKYRGETEEILYYIGGKGIVNSYAIKMLYTRLKNESRADMQKIDPNGNDFDDITLRRIIREEVRELLKGILLGGDTL